jgi:hypothetical protein
MKLHCSISGYSGLPVTLVAAFDHDTGMLLIRGERREGYLTDREDGATFVTNTVHCDARDALFTEDHWKLAIEAFHTSRATGLCVLEPKVQRFDPSQKIEVDKIDASGKSYRLSPDISNGHVAVLALVWYTGVQRGIGATMRQTTRMLDLYRCLSV